MPVTEKVPFALDIEDGWPQVATEHVWCEREGDTYTLKNVPFFIPGLALGDVFRAERDPDVYKRQTVFFEAKHFGTSTNRGRWDKKEGTVTLDKAAKTGKVEVTLDMNSISSGVPGFDRHLKSNDFFAAEQFPTAKFVGDKFAFNGDKLASVTGELTLRGKTNPVTLTANNFNCYENPMLKREVCGGDFEATIQRSQWGVSYGLPGIPDSVRIVIQIEAVKQ